MSIFKNLSNDGLEESQDRLGGYAPKETDIYSGTVSNAFVGTAQSGAMNITFMFDFGGTEYRETVYITNKDGQNYFLGKDKDGKPTGKKNPLPGFTIADDICVCAAGAPLSELEPEEKIVKIYNPESKKEEPKSVPVITALLGKPISLAIFKVLENKSKKNDSTGEYEDTAEERTVNQIEKVFHTETKMTTVEARNGQTEGKFWDAWLEKNKGQVKDKRSIKDGQGGATGAPKSNRPVGGPPQAGNAGAPRKSLFGK